MQSFPQRVFFAIVLALSMADAANAASDFGGYARVYNFSLPVPASYDADADVLSISAPANYEVFLPSCEPLSCATNMLGYQTLVMNVDEHGHSSGGVFSFVGTGTSIDVVCCDHPPPWIGSMFLHVDMDTIYADPALGPWGRQMDFGGYVYGLLPSPLTSETLFTSSWNIPGPGDYWDLWATSPVPEPSTALLAGIGVIALVRGRQRRRMR
jgi:PEP-CTERM motif